MNKLPHNDAGFTAWLRPDGGRWRKLATNRNRVTAFAQLLAEVDRRGGDHVGAVLPVAERPTVADDGLLVFVNGRLVDDAANAKGFAAGRRPQTCKAYRGPGRPRTVQAECQPTGR